MKKMSGIATKEWVESELLKLGIDVSISGSAESWFPSETFQKIKSRRGVAFVRTGNGGARSLLRYGDKVKYTNHMEIRHGIVKFVGTDRSTVEYVDCFGVKKLDNPLNKRLVKILE